MNKKFNFKKICSLGSVFFITVTNVQAANTFNSLGDLVDNLTGTVVKSVGTLMLTLAVVAFFWGIVQFIWGKSQGSGDKAKVGQEFMGWGLLALFVMFSVWGIITFFQRQLGGDFGRTTITIPSIDFKSGSGGNPQSSQGSPFSWGAIPNTATSPSSNNKVSPGGSCMYNDQCQSNACVRPTSDAGICN